VPHWPDDDPSLADLIADSITSFTGRLWDGPARARLAAWLRDPDHHEMARRWPDALPSDRSRELYESEGYRVVGRERDSETMPKVL